MSLSISSSAIAATLSEYRSDTELTRFLGIAYSTTVGWGNKENSKGGKKFQRYLLEYFRRVNFDAIEVIAKYYQLEQNTDYDTISIYLMSAKEIEAFSQSSVDWKKKVISLLRSVKKEIFILQIESIKLIVTANDNVKNISTLLENQKVREIIPAGVSSVDISYLENV